MTRSLVLRFSFLFSLLLIAQTTMAQDTVEMADKLRADGKIWVVVAVIAAVFFGIIGYLVRLDGKIGKLEREVKDGQVNTGKTTTNVGR
ncbi:CcmD family protein [Fibrivirga algicola]|uniref:CcmD family protein n=1 Tax=Fibrivirga algicola TaxID=2950420 RepID=A0ABX0QCV7_9BACT|nr:CcmD family protein [Fibrivirga algicola]ARK09234.1 CcmD family protein [Fibrella sp. ES10-3-2-2]NID08653.1 CcmD family protein [Fibrivirga algicola]